MNNPPAPPVPKSVRLAYHELCHAVADLYAGARLQFIALDLPMADAACGSVGANPDWAYLRKTAGPIGEVVLLGVDFETDILTEIEPVLISPDWSSDVSFGWPCLADRNDFGVILKWHLGTISKFATDLVSSRRLSKEGLQTFTQEILSRRISLGEVRRHRREGSLSVLIP